METQFSIQTRPVPSRAAPVSDSRLSRSIRIFRFVFAAYLVILLLMLFSESRMIFYPSRTAHLSWTPPTPGGEDVEFQSADGTRVVGWYLPHPQPQAVVLFACGNGGNMTYWRDAFQMLHKRCRVTLMGFDYRGYGRSSGSPDGPGVLADARAARKVLAEKAGVAEDRIVLMGRSLGGGVAIDLAQDGARGVVVESTFTSIPDIAAKLYPWLPVRWLMMTRFDSLKTIERFHGPLFVSHGNADTLVPLAMGQRLFDAAESKIKTFYVVQGGTHNDPQPDDYYDALGKFFAELP